MTYYLNYTQRPESVQSKIDLLFNMQSKSSKSNWGVNGASSYEICGVDDERLILNRVESSPEQKDFYFLDVGAGMYQWVDNTRKLLCNNSELPSDKQYHIIGVNAEGVDEVETTENCKIYKFGDFKTENIIEAFHERGLYLTNKVDLTVSQWTLRHLVDPLGTFLQMYKLTKPSGVMFIEGLFFSRLGTIDEFIYKEGLGEKNLNAEHFLQKDLETTYLMCPSNSAMGRAGRDIMVKKNSSVKCVSNLYYHDILDDRGEGTSNVCRYQTQFKSPFSAESRVPSCIDTYYCQFYNGDHGLYNFLEQNDLFIERINKHSFIYNFRDLIGSCPQSHTKPHESHDDHSEL